MKIFMPKIVWSFLLVPAWKHAIYPKNNFDKFFVEPEWTGPSCPIGSGPKIPDSTSSRTKWLTFLIRTNSRFILGYDIAEYEFGTEGQALIEFNASWKFHWKIFEKTLSIPYRMDHFIWIIFFPYDMDHMVHRKSYRKKNDNIHIWNWKVKSEPTG